MRSTKPVVLLVEDEADIAAIEADCLEAEGYTVLAARHGRHALELLELARPAVVVLDLVMPQLDGFGFLARWRERPQPRPPVVVVTAFEAYLEAVRATDGVAAALAKPFTPDEFLATVNACVRGSAPAPAARAVPLDERRRLRAVLELKLDEPSPTAALDAFAERVARIFDVPVSLVSIVTRDRQYWHAQCGLPGDLAADRGTPRQDSFCTHAVVAQAALVVQDTHENPFFAGNRLVRERGLRFYAGVPLLTRTGCALGTLCLLDFKPRPFGVFDLELLSVLSKRVVAELEWRERRMRPGAPASTFHHLSWLDEELDVLGREGFDAALQVEALRSAERRKPLSLSVFTTDREALAAATDAVKASFPRALLGRLALTRVGVLLPEAACAELLERLHAAAGGRVLARCTDVPQRVGSARAILCQLDGEVAALASTPPA